MRLIGGVEGIQARVGAMAPLRHDAVDKSIGHEGSSGQQRESGIEIRPVDVLATSGDSFATLLESEMGRWARVVRENNIRVDG